MPWPGSGRITRSPAVLAGVLVAVLAAAALVVMSHGRGLPVPRRAAIAAVDHSPATRAILAATHPDRFVVSAVDTRLDRVSFFTGSRIAGEALTDGRMVSQATDFSREPVPYGDWIAFRPAVLGALSVLFLLVAGVWPLRRARNLDALASVSLVVPLLLLQRRYLDASVLTALPGLLWLLARSLWWAFGSRGPQAADGSLLSMVTSAWPVARRVRVLRMVLVGLFAVFVMVGVSSPQPVDVLYAVMEGATKLLHGVLPYGHLPGDVVHGDTYPLLSYGLYLPVALIAPVTSTWDSVNAGLAVTVVFALGGAWLLAYAPAPFPRAERAPEDHEARLQAALVWLAFPPLLVTVSAGTTDVVLAVLVLAAVLAWRGSALSTSLLAAAGWYKLAPFVLLPIWLAARRGRGLVRAFAGIAIVSVPLLGTLVVLGGADGPLRMLRAMSFQFSRGSPQSIWSVLSLGSFQSIGEAGVLGLIAGAAVAVRRRPEILEDRSRLAGLSAAVLIGLQLSAGYWALLYVTWVVPLLVLSLFHPQPLAATGALEASDTRSWWSRRPIVTGAGTAGVT